MATNNTNAAMVKMDKASNRSTQEVRVLNMVDTVLVTTLSTTNNFAFNLEPGMHAITLSIDGDSIATAAPTVKLHKVVGDSETLKPMFLHNITTSAAVTTISVATGTNAYFVKAGFKSLLGTLPLVPNDGKYSLQITPSTASAGTVKIDMAVATAYI